MSQDIVLERLLSLHPRRIDFSLDRIRALLERLGRPQDSLAPIVHVAGTNGKGSTVAMMAAIWRAAGKRVQVYTSPHLRRFNERIELTNGPISEAALLDVLEECERANRGEPITFFEITTAAALLAFSREDADICLLEVGLGGRLDATNVVDPALSVITPVSHDHQDFLGDDLAAIAAEKAAILKAGAPAVIGEQEDEALAVIRTRAEKIGAPLLVSGDEWCVRRADDDAHILYRDADGALTLPRPVLPGLHQIANAGIAVRAVRRLSGAAVDPAAIAAGLLTARWPGRLQRIDDVWPGPLPPGAQLWLDGGHNAAAAAALAAFFERRGPIHLICGLLSTKNAAGFLTPFRRCLKELRTVPVPQSDCGLPPDRLCAVAREQGLPARAFETLDAALRDIEEDNAVILIAGSLYLAGSVLDRLPDTKKGAPQDALSAKVSAGP